MNASRTALKPASRRPSQIDSAGGDDEAAFITIPHAGRSSWHFHQELLESLMVPFTTSGNFSKQVVTREGNTALHAFSWATGMMYSGAQSGYEHRFSDPIPRWVEELHPVQATRLFKNAVEFGLPLPEEYELSVTAEVSDSPIPKREEVLRWADQYRVSRRWLDLRSSRELHRMLGADPLTGILSILTDTDNLRRDSILAAFRQLYEVEPPFHEPRARWAHEQLGGWFRLAIERALDKTSLRWPFRQPDTALETHA